MQASVRAFQPRQSLLILCLLSLFVGLGGKSWGQIDATSSTSITSSSAITESFTTTTGSTAYTTGFPVAWSITASGSTGNGQNINPTTTTTTAGWYANSDLGYLGSGNATSGNATWRFVNNSSSIITGFTLSFKAKMYKNGTASPNVTLSWSNSTSSTLPIASALANTLSSLTFNDATFSGTVNTTGVPLTQTVSNISIPAGSYLFIRFIHAGGSSADLLSWDDVTLTPVLATVAPTIIPSPTSLTAINYIYNAGPSASQSFTISGSNLTSGGGTVTATAPTNYQVSSDNSTFGSTASLPYTGTGTFANNTFYVRLASGLAVNASYTGSISLSGGGASAGVSVSGAVTNATPPTLTPAAGATVDAPFDVTFPDNANWRSNITSITINGTTLTAGYTVSAGKITFTPSASSPAALLQTAGSKSIIVLATNYTNATATQIIAAGAATKLAITTQPTAPASNGAALAVQPVVAVQDQYGNTTTSSASVTAAPAQATWTLGGTTTITASSGSATYSGLTASSSAAVTGATITFSSSGLTSVTSASFNIPAPAPTFTVSTSTLAFGNIGVGANSASQSVSLSGNNLTGAPGNITLTASNTNFQVSSDNVIFGATATIPYSSATLPATNFWVRFTPQSAGTKTGSISISGGGATGSVTTLTGTGINPTVVTSATVPTGTYGTALSYTIVTTGGTPTSYAIASGSTLPAGLSLNTTTGVISGTPTVVVTNYQVVVSATNAANTSTGTLTFNINPKTISYTGLSATSKVYDGTTTAPLTGMPVLSGVINGDNVSITGTPAGTYANSSVAASKAVTVTGLSLTGPDASKYTLAQPGINGTVTAKPLTVTGVTANDKVYNGLIGTTVSGTPALNGVVGSDNVTTTSTGVVANFADANVGTNKPVTIDPANPFSLSGTAANNYSIVQPTGLTASITKANQTITFPALPAKTTADQDFDPGATTTATGVTITYTSSNPAVATIVNGKIHTVGAGTTVITASQPGNGNYNAAADVTQTLTVTQGVFENFDVSGSNPKPGYAGGSVTFKSGTWYFDNTLLGINSGDKGITGNPPRLQNQGSIPGVFGSIYMQFDILNGAKEVSIYNASFGTDASSTWAMQASTDGGATWTTIGSTASTSTLTRVIFSNLNYTGNVRFKMVITGGSSGNRLNLDDFDYVPQDVTTPVFNSNLSSSRCQAAETVTYTATANYTTGITYSLDATSLAAGNTINTSTGAVTYTSAWNGTSTITASAAGGNGPKTATFVVTTSVPATINSQPTVPAGTVYTSTANAATLSVTATGASGYQWQYYNGSAWQNAAAGVPTGFSYSGGTTASLTINTGAQADTYPYRVLVSNGACSTASTTVNLVVTASAPPTVITSAPTSVTTSGAIFNGSITTANGSAINGYGFYYGTSPNPGTTGQSIGSFSNPGTYPFSFSTTTMSGGNPVTLSGPNVLYYVQAFASVSAGQPGNGSVLTFYTLANVPNAPSISNITATTFDVTINPNNNPAGTAYVVRLVSGGNTYYLKADGSLSTTEVWITGTSITTTGLTPATAYTVSVKARNGDLVETAYSGTTIATTLNNPLTASYRSLTSGNFATASTWEYNSTGTTYVTATSAPSSANPVLIRHAVTLSASYSSAAGFTLTSDGAFTPSLIISPTGVLSSTAGTVNFNGKPVTVSSTTAGTGSIGIMASTISGATAVTVERYTNGSLQQSESRRAWRLMTSPVSGQTIHQSWQENGVNDNTYGTLITGYNLPDAATAAMQGYDFTGAYFNTSIKHYVPASNAWVPLSSDGSTTGTNIPVRNEQAYMVYVRGDRTITTAGSSNATLRATGTLQQGTQPAIPLSAGSYTLVGNPYASSIDFASLYSNNTGAILNQFYLWNSKLGTYGAYAFVSRNAANTAYVVTPGTLSTSNNDAYRYIPSGSGFFVTPRTSPSVTSITIREADKAAGSIPPISPFRVIPVATNVRELLVNLNLKDSDTSATLADGFRALFSDDYAGNEKDNSNAKAFNFNENLGLVQEQDSLIIEARADVKKTDTLYMKLWNITKRAYQFQVKAANFTNAPGIRAWLEDSYLATKQELALNGSITTVNFDVTTDAASASSDRFRIVFENNTTVLPVTITKVSAQPKSGGAEVNWTVANETNIKGYTVEKSIDGGRTFSGMGTQQAAHNNPQAALTVYSGYDAAPQTGDNYYRIRIEAKDGTISYSDIVKVTIGANGTGIQITLYPNPVREGKANLQMTNLSAGTYLVSVYTGSGQTVYQKKITITQPNTTQSEQLLLGNNIAQGSYRIKLSDSKGKLMKEQSFIVAK